MIETKENNRNIAYDVLRIIAILLVFYNHRYTFTISDSFNNITISYIITCILSIISKCGVPIFFMISGAVLLDKKEKYTYILKHRVLRILIVMFICLVLLMIRDKDFNILHAFKNLNWFLYHYLIYLLILPLLRKFVSILNNKRIILFSIIIFVFYTIFSLLYLFNVLDESPIVFFGTLWLIIYPVIGYYIKKVFSNKKSNIKKIMMITGIISFIVLILYIIACSIDIKINGAMHLDDLRSQGTYPISCLIFMWFYSKKDYFNKCSLKDMIIIFSNATFGAYIIDISTSFSIRLYDIVYEVIGPYIGNYFTSLISIFIIFIVYVNIITLLRTIPIMKKIL